jgi:DNA recombination protein RmuC
MGAGESDNKNIMETVLFTLGGMPITIIEALAAGLGLAVLLLVVLLISQSRAARQREEQATSEMARTAEMERHMADMMRIQSEMTGRMQTMSEIFGTRTSDLARVLTERIDGNTDAGPRLPIL